MIITNITDKGAPKPIGIGPYIIMPGETQSVPDEVAYVDEFVKPGVKSGKKAVLPAIRLLVGMNQITFEEEKKAAPVKEKAPAEEVVTYAEETDAPVKKTGGRKKKTDSV